MRILLPENITQMLKKKKIALATQPFASQIQSIVISSPKRCGYVPVRSLKPSLCTSTKNRYAGKSILSVDAGKQPSEGDSPNMEFLASGIRWIYFF